MRAAVLVFAVALAASGCVGEIVNTSGPLETGDGGAASGPDGAQPLGQRDCTQPGACPCTTNYDCQNGFTCFPETETKVYCAVGARGTGRLGQACPNGNRDCLSGICVTPAGGSPICSDKCATTECDGTALPTCTELNTTPVAQVCL